ncbi:hypothetical protein MUO65_00840, partial [bacterium]|nr:hypothetical protein [bacterium]
MMVSYEWIKKNKLIFIILVLAIAGILMAVTSRIAKHLSTKRKLPASIGRGEKTEEMRKKGQKET